MKIIPRKNVDLEQAILLFTTHTQIKLWRLGVDQYAFTKEGKDGPILAFESEPFSYLIDTLDQLHDVAIIGCNCACCDGEHRFVEIRLLIEDGKSYYFDSNENVVETSTVEFAERDDCPAPTPCEHWALPDEAPYKHMFVSFKLADRITKVESPTSIPDILERMWFETRKLRKPNSINKLERVSGEFCDYATHELRCGRILFMTSDDIKHLTPTAPEADTDENN
jgi:hypothetical protein